MNMMQGGPPAQQMQGQGTVKKWFGEKGYGFLVPQNGGVDIFVHRRALSGIYDLNEGDTVLFDAEFEEARNKWKAYKCQLLESANPGMPGMLPPGPQPQRGGGGKRGGGGRGKGGGFPMNPMDEDMLDDGMLPPMGGLGMNMGMPGGGGFGLGKKGNSRGGGRGGNKGGGFPLDPMDNDDMLGMDMGMGMPGGGPRMGGNPQFGAGRKGGGGGKGYNDNGSPNLDNFSNMMASMGMPDGGKKGGGRGRGDKGKGGKNMNNGGRGGRGGGGGNQFNPNGGNKGGGKPFDLGDMGGGGNRGPGGMRGGGGGGNRGPAGVPPPLDQPQSPQNDQGKMQVVAELPLNWVQLRGPEGTFFVNSTTRQVTQDVPPELRQLAEQQTNLPSPLQQPPPMQGGQRLGGGGGGGQFPFPNQPQQFQQSPQQVGLMSQQMSPQPPLPHMMQNSPPMQQPQSNNEVTLKATLGNWLVCEDAQGVFYRDSRSGQTFDQMPPELQRMYNEQDMMGGMQQAVPPPMQQQNPMYQQHLQQAPYNPGQFNDYLDMPQAYEHQSM